MSSYLVTGGAGFIGSHLATELVARGHRVRVLDNLSTGHRHNLAHLSGVEFIEGDCADLEACVHAVQGMAPVVLEMVQDFVLGEFDTSRGRQQAIGTVFRQVVEQPLAGLAGVAADGGEILGGDGDFHWYP